MSKRPHTFFVYPAGGQRTVSVRRIFLFSVIFYSCAGFADLSSFCRRLWFSSSPPSLNLETRQTHTNPLTNVFIEALLEAEQRGWLPSRPDETEDFQKGAEDMISFLEKEAGAREQTALTQREIPLKPAMEKLPLIMKSLEDPAESPSTAYFEETALAVLALFSKHLPSLLRVADPYHSGYGKINPILKTIARFNPKRPRFSLYKIKRSVERYFSLKEFSRARYP